MSHILPEKTFALFDTPPNRKLIARLMGSGLKTILFPPIETEKVDLSRESSAIMQNLTNFDWIIFPDVYTVEFFLQKLGELKIDLFELDALNVCVYGEAISDKLRFSQLHADLIVNQPTDEAVFQGLSNYLNEEIKNLKFILTKEISFEYKLKILLKNWGAQISEIPLYAVKPSSLNDLVKLKTLLKGGAIDEFIFSADEDLIALKHYFADESMTQVLEDIKISAVSQTIFQTLKENNLRPKLFIFGEK